LKEAYVWIDSYRQFWDGAFDRLDTLLTELQHNSKETPRHARKSPVRKSRVARR
jgi:hypothetical protein